jgi:DNA polymerase I-like protein with 3'-5' exonuclease and polymerase domains
MKFNPAIYGAECSRCPLKTETKFFEPVPQFKFGKPRCIVVAHSPTSDERWAKKAGSGKLYLNVINVLKHYGIAQNEIQFVYRLSCVVPNRIDGKKVTLAENCCAPRVKVDLGEAKLPTLFLGRDSTLGILGQREEQSARNCPQLIDDRWVLVTGDTPQTAYANRPGVKPMFEAQLHKFGQCVSGTYKQQSWGDEYIHVSEGMLQALLLIRDQGKDVGWDIETQGTDPLSVPITALGISDGELSVCMPWDDYHAKDWGAVDGLATYGTLGEQIRKVALEILADKNRKMFTQNGNYDTSGFQARNIDCRNDIDILNAHSLLYPALDHDLESIGLHMLNLDHRWKATYRSGWGAEKKYEKYVGGPPDRLRLYCARDCTATVLSGQRLLTQMAAADYPALQTIFAQSLEHTAIALRGYLFGWTIDETAKADIRKEVEDNVRKYKAELLAHLPAETNPNSKTQMARLFYEVWGEPITHKTDSGAGSVDKEAKEHIKNYGVSEEGRKCAELSLELEKWEKRYSSYVKKFEHTKIIRSSPRVTQQISGRWSYTNPALQTFPQFCKGMFVARPGNYLVACDYSQAELRLMALLSGDQPLLQAYKDGVDTHSLNASVLFGVPLDKMQKKFRNAAKTFAFALNYSTLDEEISAKTILSRMHAVGFAEITYQQVVMCIQRWWLEHPAIYAYKDKLYKESCAKDYVEDVFSGRRRYFFGKVKDTECYNFPLQSGAAYCMNRAAILIDAGLDHAKEGLLLQRHDEFIVEGPDKDKLVELLQNSMTLDLTYNGNTITMETEASVGTRWGMLKEIHK